MGSFSLCSFRNPILWTAVLVPVFMCSSFSGSGYLSFIITCLIFTFYAIFLTKFTKQKQVLEDESPQVHVQPLFSKESLDCQVEEFENLIRSVKYFQENEIDLGDDDDCLAKGSLDSYSENEVVDQYSSSEDSDIDWPFSGNIVGTSDFSDGSISDEESLIEIALPSGHYIGSEEEDDEKLKWDLPRKCQNFPAEDIFGKGRIMELLAEINDVNEHDHEEDNLIEIDLSMGSIKCSRFEIEA